MTMNPIIRAELIDLMDRFLLQHRQSSSAGGWAEVEDEDFQLLDKLIEKLVQSKCDKDADGDYPIEWKLTNRRKYIRNQFARVPYYWRREATEQEKILARKAVLFNLQRAAHDLEEYFVTEEDYKNANKHE